jgi:sugar/nucleoside kinase (ribokinase family)
MKILLIGHSAEDHIYYKDTVQLKPGGLFYTSAAMLNIKDEDDEVYVITSIDDNSYHLFSSVYDKLNNDYSLRGNGVTPVVRLDIYDEKERTERYLRMGEQLKVPYSRLQEFDGILINMISGFDISLEQLKEIRKNFNKTIYMDVHTLSRGVGKNLERPQIIIKNFSDWAANLDIIQVNQAELFSLYHNQNEEEIARRVLDAGAAYLIVTKDSAGASLYFHDNGMQHVMVPGLKVNVKNLVGCGDVFGAVFFYSFLKFGNAVKSLNMANTAAGIVTSYDNFEEISNLRYDFFT